MACRNQVEQVITHNFPPRVYVDAEVKCEGAILMMHGPGRTLNDDICVSAEIQGLKLFKPGQKAEWENEYLGKVENMPVLDPQVWVAMNVN